MERIKSLKEDLDKGEWWTEAYKGPGSAYWITTFPDEEVSIKILFTYDMPMPAEKFLQLLHPSAQESRHKWDDGFNDLEILEAYADGGLITYMRAVTSWPLTDRSCVLFCHRLRKSIGMTSELLLWSRRTQPTRPSPRVKMVVSERIMAGIFSSPFQTRMSQGQRAKCWG